MARNCSDAIPRLFQIGKFLIMTKESVKSRVYVIIIIMVGLSLWLAATASFFIEHTWREQLAVIALVPLIVVMGMFPNTFPLPSGLKLTQEKLTFTLSDALVLLVACWFGLASCIFVAGIEGYTSSRRTIRRLSSNLFSFGMMSLAAAAAAVSLNVVLRYGFGEASAHTLSFHAITIALLVASIVHILVNTGLISTLFALRLGNPVLSSWRHNFVWAAPMFLPTGAAASLMYITLQYNALTMVAIGAPIMIAIHLGLRRYRDSMQEQINIIERSQQERIGLMEKSHRETIEALAVAINAKDEVTHEHVLRVQIYAAGVARILGCSEAEVEALRAGALLHDIGKIAVPDYILNKPGKLTAAEFEKMKTHTIVGGQILSRVEFPYPIVPVVRHHHERWDGRGYPDGLKGEGIPLTARILSVVDCFDAVREDRQYRKAMTREEALDFIMGGSGTMYDPRVVGTFITHLPEFEAEILAHRNTPAPTYGITPLEELSEAARLVVPAAGLAETVETDKAVRQDFSLKELRALYELSQSVNVAGGREATLAAFTEKLQGLVPYDSCTVTMVAHDGEDNVVAHARGQHEELLRGRKIAIGEGVTGWVLANRQPFCNTDPKLDLSPQLAEHFGDYKTLAVFPLLKETEMHGALTLYSSTLAEYDADHRRLIEEAAKLVTAALATSTEPAPPTTRPQPITDSPASLTPVFRSSLQKPTNVVVESELAH
jgi:putative nucleotidyltransferase with HDIG domain